MHGSTKLNFLDDIAPPTNIRTSKSWMQVWSVSDTHFLIEKSYMITQILVSPRQPADGWYCMFLECGNRLRFIQYASCMKFYSVSSSLPEFRTWYHLHTSPNHNCCIRAATTSNLGTCRLFIAAFPNTCCPNFYRNDQYIFTFHRISLPMMSLPTE